MERFDYDSQLFVKFIKATKDELDLRNEIIDEISSLVKSLWPDADVIPVGSTVLET